MLAIIIVLVVLGSLDKTLTNVNQKLVAVGNVAFHGLIADFPRRIRPQGRRVSTKDHTERRVLQEGSIVAIFRPRKPMKPLPRTVASEATQIHANDPIDRLRLAIRLRVKCRTQCKREAEAANRAFQNPEVKTTSRSETMEAGTPWRRTMSTKKALATDSAV